MSGTSIPLSDISAHWKLKDEVVYGPFATRRKGMALGINVLAIGEKFCSFNCVYCQCGWTRSFDPAKALPEHYLDLRIIESELDRRFSEIKGTGERADRIVLSGNGEPTLHPKFNEVCCLLVAARDKHFPNLEIQCLTDGTELGRAEVVEGLKLLDRPTFKLDAATPAVLKRVDIPLVDFDLDVFEQRLQSIPKVFLQACFFRGRIANDMPDHIEAWLERVGRIRPREVEIYSIHRETAAKGLEPVTREWLEGLAARLKALHGVDSQVV
ncbi:MAG: radical SAM protein [Planctomycetota bacterium]